jgi:hypothetical protein
MKEVDGTSRDEYPDTELDIVPTLFSDAPPVRFGCIKSTLETISRRFGGIGDVFKFHS